MTIEEKIRNILFEIGKDIKIHKISSENMIIEIDYDKYVNQIIDIFSNKDDGTKQ